MTDFQIADAMDKPCKVVDFLKNKGPPYVPNDGYPCNAINGEKISEFSKRDIGVMINVIITYKNKSVVFASLFLHLSSTLSCRYGEGEWGVVPINIESEDITYTVEVKYALTQPKIVN